MIRRYKNVSFCALLNNAIESDYLDQNLSATYTLTVVDDRVTINERDFEQIISIIQSKFSNRHKLEFNNLRYDSYATLVKALKKYNVLDARVVQLRDKNYEIIYRVSGEDSITPVKIDAFKDKVFDLPYDCYRHINNGINYDRNVLNDQLFAMGVESIVNQINHYAENDS